MYPRVAFIDDDKSILESIKLLFKDEPYELYVFVNPFEAIKEISEKEFALVIVDLIMPQIKGNDVIKEIHRIQPWTECMLMTVNTYLVDEVHSARKVIEKPWNVIELKETVKQSILLSEDIPGTQ